MPDGLFEKFLTAVTGDTPEARREFKRYQAQGGGLSLNQWLRQGRPTPPTQITARTREIMERTGGIDPGVIGGEAPSFGGITPAQRITTQAAGRAAAGVDLTAGAELGGFRTQGEAQDKVRELQRRFPNKQFRANWDSNIGRYIVRDVTPVRQPIAPITPTRQREFETQQQQFEEQQRLAQARFEEQQRQFEQQLELQRQQQAGLPITPTRQQEFDIQRQQFEQQFGLQQQQQQQAQAQFQAQLQFQQEQARLAAEEEERQFRSQLQANPINWLQYSAYTGQPPVIQPWMKPLGFQDTGGALTPGQPILGFQPTAGTPTTTGAAGTQTFANLPALTTPSAQLQARWGPTAQAQFLGYRRARTGATPQETTFRLGAGRAPAGRFPGFSRFR